MQPGEEHDITITLVDEPAAASRDNINMEGIGTLADDIATNGLLQRPGVRGPLDGGRYEIIWGHRRLLALRLLRWPTVPVKVYPPDYDPDIARVAENLQREELTPIEEGRECAKFINKGHTRGQVARLFRRSPAWVDGRLELLALPPDLQAAINDKTLSAGVARVLGQVDHDGYRRALINDAKATGATVAIAEYWLQHYRAHGERLIKNETTIQAMVEEREAFKIMVPCQGCGDDTDYAKTQSLRLCNECIGAVGKVFQALADGTLALPS
jgi:ParB family transcriptional regulator, chromosome partitioning protein